MAEKTEGTVTVQRTYSLLHPIGEGSMGTVVEAVEPASGQHVAVKVLHAEHMDNAPVRERFEAEAAVLTSVDHPGSIPVYGTGNLSDGRAFFVMKKVEGRTLRDLFVERGDRVGDLTWRRRLLGILERVCETVAYAHRRGIVHRDLKPENILIDDNGAVLVIDWGLSKRTSGAASPVTLTPTVDGAVMGSPGYMAPEQARGESAQMTPQGDVFALGVMLYEILTGVQPFSDEDPRKSLLSVIHREPEDPRHLSSWVTKSMAAICRKALEKDPFRRYATADELLEDVNAFRSGHPISVGRRTLLEKALAWYKGNPFQFAVVLSVSLALMLAGGILGVQFWLDHRLADETLQLVEEIDAEIDVLKSDVNRIREVRADAPEPERAALDAELRQLGNEIVLKQLEAYYAARSVIELRFIRVETGALQLRRRRFFDTIRAALDYGEPELAKSLTDLATQRYNQRPWQDVSESDLERFRALATEAEAAVARTSLPSQRTETERR